MAKPTQAARRAKLLAMKETLPQGRMTQPMARDSNAVAADADTRRFDEAVTALEEARALILVLESYLCSDDATDCPVAHDLMRSYCDVIDERIRIGQSAMRSPA